MISDHLRSVARRFPGELAIVDGGQRISFGELLERVLVARDWLRKSLDPKPGDVIAVALDNSWQFAACLFAVSELGCALLPCNPQWRAAELRAVAGRLGFRGAVVEPRLTAEWNQILDIVPSACVLSVESMPARYDLAASSPPPIDSVADDAPAIYLPTSGSTGVPRLVTRSHRNLMATVQNVASSANIAPGRRFLSVVPFHYSNGFHNSLIVPLLSAATLVIMRQFSPGTCAELVHREQADTLFGSPYIFGYLVDGVRHPSLLISLKYCYNAGARIPSGVVQRWRDRFSGSIRQSYGMSEAGLITMQRTEEAPESSIGSYIGEPLCGVEVVVLGSDDQCLEPGERGELAVRSASVMSGYFGQPDLTRGLFHNGFFRTGDLGCFDSAGQVHLIGRMGRVINIAGVKVDPGEVERAVEMLPNVASCHVDAVLNGRGGEVVRARVVPRDGLQVTRREVIEQCRRQLAEYKIPRVIEFLEGTPITIAGKTPRRGAPGAASGDQPPGSR